MGFALNELGQLDASIEAFNKALSLKPDYAKSYNNMGIALRAKRKLEDANRRFSRKLCHFCKIDYADVR